MKNRLVLFSIVVSMAFLKSNLVGAIPGDKAVQEGQQPQPKPVTVMVVDSPMDYSHEALSPYVDVETLDSLYPPSDEGQEDTIKEKNQKIVDRIFDRHGEKTIALATQFLDDTHFFAGLSNRASENFLPRFSSLVKGMIRYFIFPRFRAAIRDAAILHHGTHVAGIMMDGASSDSVRLLHFPAVGASKKVTLKTLRGVKRREDFTRSIRAQMEFLDKVIKEQDVKVVNLSLGSGMHMKRTLLKSGISPWARFLRPFKVRKALNLAISETYAQYYRLAEANPDTVFVFAAGNETTAVEDIGVGTAALERDSNVLQVGALSYLRTLAKFSNWSKVHVEAGALGVSILSGKYGGGNMFMSGTSQAAPAVAATLREIRTKYPNLSAQEAILLLNVEYMDEMDHLKDLIEEGRVLRTVHRISLGEKDGVSADWKNRSTMKVAEKLATQLAPKIHHYDRVILTLPGGEEMSIDTREIAIELVNKKREVREAALLKTCQDALSSSAG